MSVVKKVGGDGDSASSPVGARPLNNEAVFRIELSFSSRRSSVIVMRCTARLYALEVVGQGRGKGEGQQQPPAAAASSPGKGRGKGEGLTVEMNQQT